MYTQGIFSLPETHFIRTYFTAVNFLDPEVLLTTMVDDILIFYYSEKIRLDISC